MTTQMTPRVREIMNQPAFTCRASESLDRAAGLMWDHDVGLVPVVDEDGQLVGVITDRDICMAAYTQGHALTEIPVERAMAKEVFTCRLDDEVVRVEAMMAEVGIRRVPVVDADGMVIGVVSLADIAQLAMTSQAPPSTEHEVAETLAAITRPSRRMLAEC